MGSELSELRAEVIRLQALIKEAIDELEECDDSWDVQYLQQIARKVRRRLDDEL